MRAHRLLLPLVLLAAPSAALAAPPAITGLANRTTGEDVNVAVAFTVADDLTPVDQLTLAATSSNQALVTDAGLSISGTTGMRTLNVTLVPNASGMATLTVTALDADNELGMASLVLTVTATNDPPTLPDLMNATIAEDGTHSVTFEVGDVETPAGNLAVTATAANTMLVPMVLVGSNGASRTLEITPAANRFGTTTVTVRVTDGNGANTTDTFDLTVTSVNDVPTVSTVPNQRINEGTATTPLAFTVGDVESPTLMVTRASSNLTLVPLANVVLGGTGANRTVRVTPVPGLAGTTTITLTATDADGGAGTSTFEVVVNDLPTISDIPNTMTPEDTATGAIPFTVGDADGDPATLTLSATSTNAVLLPVANVMFGGAGANRTVTLTPVANQAGTSTVTVLVSDGLGNASDSFQLAVTAVNDAPTVSAIADQALNAGGQTPPLPFTVGDLETAAALLPVTVASNNTTLVPASGLTLGGTGANRTLVVRPAAGQAGTATITVTVRDTGSPPATATTSFQVNVNALPTISNVANQSVAEDGTLSNVAFTIGDAETAAMDLSVTATSSAPLLIPNARITLGGTGANRTVTLQPLPNLSGMATITLTVTDLNGGTATDTFVVNVTAVDDPPTFPDIPDQALNVGVASASLPITITDPDSPAPTVTATSNNAAVVPPGGLVLGGTGRNRSLVVTASGAGTATITVRVNDGVNPAAVQTFNVAANAVPQVSAVSNVTLPEDTATMAIPFTVTDADNGPMPLTVTATSSNTALVPNANLTLGGTNPNRTIRVTPVANGTGVTTITISATDGQATRDEVFTVTWNPVNDVPTITTVMDQMVPEDGTTGPLAFTVGDVETNAAALTVTATSSNTAVVPAARVTLGGSGANRTVTVAPAPNQSGMSTITLRVTDGGMLFATTTFNVTVSAVNDAPTLAAIADRSTPEDTTAAIPLTVGDVETPAANLVLSGTSSNLTLVPVANMVFSGTTAARTLTVTPAANQTGTAMLTVRVTDGSMGFTERTFTLTVTAVNDPPTISNIPNQNTPLNTAIGPIAFTVGDVDNTNLTVTATSGNTALIPAAGIALGGAATDTQRTITLTPANNASGVAVITVRVSDGTATAQDVFTLTVSAPGNPPTITPIADQNIQEDAPNGTGDLTFTVGDTENAPNQLTVGAQAADTATVAPGGILLGGTGAARTIRVRPAANYCGPIDVTVTVVDLGGGAAVEDFRVNVACVNDAPTLAAIGNQMGMEDMPVGPLTLGAADVDGDVLMFTVTSSNQALIPDANLVVGTGLTGETQLTLTPAPQQSGGPVTITVTARDAVLTAQRTFSVTIQPVNDAPMLGQVGDQTIAEDSATGVLDVVVADVENDAVTLSATTDNPMLVAPAGLVLGGSGNDRTVQVTPLPNACGTAMVTVTGTDAGGAAGTMVFRLDVTCVNDTPTLAALADVSTAEDVPSAEVALTVDDADGMAADLVVTATSSDPLLIPNDATHLILGGTGGARTLVVLGAPNASGTADVTVRVTDAVGAFVEDTFQVTITAVNDAPQVAAVGDQMVNEDGTLGPVMLDVTDDGPLDAVTLTGSSQDQGRVTDAAVVLTHVVDGMWTLTVTPVPDASGTVVLTVTAFDGTSMGTRDVTLTIVPVNDAPVAQPLMVTTAEDTPVMLMLPGSDADGETPTLTVVVAPMHGTLTGSGLTPTYTPAPNTSGPDSFTYRLTDAAGATSTTERVDITVTAAPDAPVFVSPPTPVGTVSAPVGVLLTFTVAATDADGDAVTLSVGGLPGGAAFDAGTGVFSWTPQAAQSGDHPVTLTASDGTLTAERMLVLVVDADTDGDGLLDGVEVTLATLVNDPDSDDDTIPDGEEVGPDVRNARNSDTDALIDALDDDSDGDTILDAHEAGDADPGTPPRDSDGDDTPDYRDTDSDADGVDDADEAGDTLTSSFPVNSDGTDQPDYLDTDSDNDTVLDDTDNCRTSANTDQTDGDANGRGDACDGGGSSSSSSGMGGGSSVGGGGSSQGQASSEGGASSGPEPASSSLGTDSSQGGVGSSAGAGSSASGPVASGSSGPAGSGSSGGGVGSSASQMAGGSSSVGGASSQGGNTGGGNGDSGNDAGGGGCACRQDVSAGPAGVWLGLGLLAVVRRWRRRS